MTLFARFARVAIGCICVVSLASDLGGQGYKAMPSIAGRTAPRFLEGPRAIRVSIPSHFPTVDWSMNNPALQSPALCAVSCFAATYSFSTIPYYSLDQARSVTLVYNGDQAAPRPFIYADVDDGYDGTSVAQYTMSATLNGTAVTFLNGQTVVTFPGPGYSGTTVRLAGQFDARSYSTDVYPLVITVRVTYTDNVVVTKTGSTQIMILNESGSQIAKGWTVAGLQRLRTTTSPGYMITNGDGSATRFSGLGAVAADYTTLTYDSPSGTYTRTYPDASRALFNVYGTQISIIAANGLTTSYGYDGNGRLQDIRDPYRKQPNGSVTSIGLYYGTNGLGGTVEPGPDGTQWMGRTTGIVVDGNRCLVSAEDPDHVLTTFTCDANGRLSTITDRRGGVTTLVYDPTSWKLSQIIEPQIAVDAGGGGTTLVNPVASYSPWQTQTPAIVSSISGSVTDPAGRVTRFVPNRFGQGTDITDPAGMHTMTTYSGALPKTITYPNGAIDTLGYDASGRVTKSHLSGGYVTTYTYTAGGLLATVGGPGSRAETRTYVNNQLTSISLGGSQPQTLNYSYDPATQRVSSMWDNPGHKTSYIYDPRFGNVQQTTIPGNRTTTKAFDAIGRDSVTTSPQIAPQTTLYDIVNRPISSSGGGSTISLGYDQLYQTDVYDANGNHYHADYNALGWPTRACDASSLCSTTRYDASGAVTSTTNRRNQIQTLTRDGAGRLTSQSGAGTLTNNYSYSSNGRITVAWNAVQRDSIFVDPGSLTLPATDSVVTWVRDSILGDKRFRIFHRPARPIADMDSTNITSNTGVTFNSRKANYSSSGFLTSLMLDLTSVTFAPDADGTGGTTTLPGNGIRTSHALATHSTADVSFGNPNLNGAFRRQYHYDQAGRIDQVMTGSPTSFSYDALGRLSSRSVQSCTGTFSAWPPTDTTSGPYATCTGGTTLTDAFTYDAMGNRTDQGGVPTTGNRYSTLKNASYYYDADGNVTQKYNAGLFNRQWYWNARGQLDSAIKDGIRTGFDYNALGKPVRIRDGSNVGKYLIWDGDALLAEFSPSWQRQADYVYLPGTIDRPFAHTLGPTTPTTIRYHQIDELGNVVGTSESGTVIQNSGYDAWGAVTYGSNPDQHLGWKGLLSSGDSTGLLFVRNRWYDPEGGRFVNEDPAGFAGGANLYTFADNDPVNGRDPSGLDFLSCYYTPGYEESTANGTISYAGYWTCYGGGGDGGGGGSSGPSNYDPRHGGGGGGSGKPQQPPKPGQDAGQHAERVCQAAIGLTAASLFLESAGAMGLYKGLKAISALRSTSRFAATFQYSVPDAIRAYTRGRVTAAGRSVAGGYAYGWGQSSAIGYFGEAAMGAEHIWWGYVPVLYATTGSFAIAAQKACFNPGP